MEKPEIKEIVQKLLVLYKWALEEVQKMNNFENIIDFLYSNHLYMGVCFASLNHGIGYLYNEDWVRSRCPKYSTNWCAAPEHCNTKEEIIESLSTRIKILEDEI